MHMVWDCNFRGKLAGRTRTWSYLSAVGQEIRCGFQTGSGRTLAEVSALDRVIVLHAKRCSLPEQIGLTHKTRFVLSPTHGCPPGAGVGLVQYLVCISWPMPHVTLQAVVMIQALQPPSTVTVHNHLHIIILCTK